MKNADVLIFIISHCEGLTLCERTISPVITLVTTPNFFKHITF